MLRNLFSVSILTVSLIFAGCEDSPGPSTHSNCSQCEPGQSECNGDSLRSCQESSPGCYVWTLPTKCAGASSLCDNGACVAECEVDCFVGEKRCNKGDFQTCENNDNDSCPQWSETSSCPQDDVCYQGDCIDPKDYPFETVCQKCGQDDGIGGKCQIGSCEDENETCVEGECICVPNCDDKACGDSNGCGGTCAGADCNPCDNMTCDEPPTPQCKEDETTSTTLLVEYALQGECIEGECVYPVAIEVPCEFGCAKGECLADPCETLVCDAPPSDFCGENNTLMKYATVGKCEKGECTYELVVFSKTGE